MLPLDHHLSHGAKPQITGRRLAQSRPAYRDVGTKIGVQPLQSRGDVHHIANGRVLELGLGPKVAYRRLAGMDPDPGEAEGHRLAVGIGDLPAEPLGKDIECQGALDSAQGMI